MGHKVHICSVCMCVVNNAHTFEELHNSLLSSVVAHHRLHSESLNRILSLIYEAISTTVVCLFMATIALCFNYEVGVRTCCS